MFKDDFEIDRLIASDERKIPNNLDGYDALVILGGPASVYENFQYLKDEEKLIKSAITKDVPTLGICLGSQLIAKAAGTRVYKGPKKEIGWYPVELTNYGINGIFNGMKKNLMVFQWHGDTYDLPNNAVPLASSELYPVQAFRVGSAIGIQFHLEVSKEMAMDWVKEYEAELKSVRDYIDTNSIIAGFDAHGKALKQYTSILYRNFKKLIK